MEKQLYAMIFFEIRKLKYAIIINYRRVNLKTESRYK